MNDGGDERLGLAGMKICPVPLLLRSQQRQ
jgi:hypothetical protein